MLTDVYVCCAYDVYVCCTEQGSVLCCTYLTRCILYRPCYDCCNVMLYRDVVQSYLTLLLYRPHVIQWLDPVMLYRVTWPCLHYTELCRVIQLIVQSDLPMCCYMRSDCYVMQSDLTVCCVTQSERCVVQSDLTVMLCYTEWALCCTEWPDCMLCYTEWALC